MQRIAAAIDVERAKLAPADEFDHPDDVVSDTRISIADKTAILAQWETDAEALARAGDEGMTGGEPPQLREVKLAQERLRRISGGAESAESRNRG